jgi:hypothetical protein
MAYFRRHLIADKGMEQAKNRASGHCLHDTRQEFEDVTFAQFRGVVPCYLDGSMQSIKTAGMLWPNEGPEPIHVRLASHIDGVEVNADT